VQRIRHIANLNHRRHVHNMNTCGSHVNVFGLFRRGIMVPSTSDRRPVRAAGTHLWNSPPIMPPKNAPGPPPPRE
jgi:hypothetical protein